MFKGCSVRRVERRGPSSFLAMSYFICRSLLIGLASVRAHEDVSPRGPTSGSWDFRERNSAILEALLRARFLARKSDISLIVWLAGRGEWRLMNLDQTLGAPLSSRLDSVAQVHMFQFALIKGPSPR